MKLSRAVSAGLLPATESVYIDYNNDYVTLKPSGRVVTVQQIEDENWGAGVAITGPIAPSNIYEQFAADILDKAFAQPAARGRATDLGEIFGRDI